MKFCTGFILNRYWAGQIATVQFPVWVEADLTVLFAVDVAIDEIVCNVTAFKQGIVIKLDKTILLAGNTMDGEVVLQGTGLQLPVCMVGDFSTGIAN